MRCERGDVTESDVTSEVGGTDHLYCRGKVGLEGGGGAGGELRGDGDRPASPSLSVERRDGDSVGREDGGST